MSVEIEVPEEYMGDVMGDLTSRRGRLRAWSPTAGVSVIRAQVPMAEMLTYAPDLKSMTAGPWLVHHGSEPLRRGPVPPHRQDRRSRQGRARGREGRGVGPGRPSGVWGCGAAPPVALDFRHEPALPCPRPPRPHARNRRFRTGALVAQEEPLAAGSEGVPLPKKTKHVQPTYPRGGHRPGGSRDRDPRPGRGRSGKGRGDERREERARPRRGGDRGGAAGGVHPHEGRRKAGAGPRHRTDHVRPRPSSAGTPGRSPRAEAGSSPGVAGRREERAGSLRPR